VFTNDDPLNGADPLGLCWPSWACKAVDKVTHVVATVMTFEKDNAVAITGLGLDGLSVGFDIAGAVTADPGLSLAGSALGYAGAVTSAIGCKDQSSLSCIGVALGAASATAGLVEIVIESVGAESATSAVLKGVGINLGAASATLDVAVVVVAIDKAVEKSAKSTAKKITSKK
jgi:hypothetical protein